MTTENVTEESQLNYNDLVILCESSGLSVDDIMNYITKPVPVDDSFYVFTGLGANHSLESRWRITSDLMKHTFGTIDR